MHTSRCRSVLLSAALVLVCSPAMQASLPKSKEDMKRVINSSMSLLKNREPEMTGAEFLLYQKVVAMLQVEPKFAMQLIEGMMSGKDRPSPAFEFVLGNVHYMDGRAAEAEKYFRRAIEQYPDFLRAWSNLGALLYSTEKYDEAARCLARAVQLGDTSADTLGMMAFSLRRNGQPAAAEMAYLRALSMEPESADWIEGLAGLFVGSGQYARAEPLVRQLVRLAPGEARHWSQLAGVLLEQGNKNGAMVALESARLLRATSPELLRQLGDLYAQLQFTQEAATVYLESMSADPDLGAKRLLVLAQAVGREGQLPRAFEMLASLEPNLQDKLRPDFLLVRAELAAASKDWAATRRDLKEVLVDQPLNGEAWLNLGRTALEQGDLVAAKEAFAMAVRRPKSAFLARLELANFELRDHHYSESAEHLREALVLEDTPAVRAFLARIQQLATQNEKPSP